LPSLRTHIATHFPVDAQAIDKMHVAFDAGALRDQAFNGGLLVA
jgi:hypothetical protein